MKIATQKIFTHNIAAFLSYSILLFEIYPY